MPRALVTGATGLIGSHIAERLLRDGWHVRALTRAEATELDPAVEIARGDILDEEAFGRAAAGCDVIFHCAAVITPTGGREEFERQNVVGARTAIAAARAAGARLLQLSSVAVYGSGARYGDRPTGEETPLAPLPADAHYARTKRDSEALVLAAHGEGRIWAAAVRPSVVYGPRDRQFVPRMARMLRFGVAPIIGNGRTTLAVVHAANVADGAILAAASDAAGGRVFNLANDFDVTVRSFFRLAGEGLGRRVRFARIPLWAAHAGLRAARLVDRAALGGRFSVALSGSLSFMTRDNPFSSELARRELGWVPEVRPEAGVPEAFRWARRRERASG